MDTTHHHQSENHMRDRRVQRVQRVHISMHQCHGDCKNCDLYPSQDFNPEIPRPTVKPAVSMPGHAIDINAECRIQIRQHFPGVGGPKRVKPIEHPCNDADTSTRDPHTKQVRNS